MGFHDGNQYARSLPHLKNQLDDLETVLALFEIGSLICGVAPSMNVLIFGRAFAGVGAAGMFGSCIAIIAEICPLEKRPALLGTFGGVFALASVRVAQPYIIMNIASESVIQGVRSSSRWSIHG